MKAKYLFLIILSAAPSALWAQACALNVASGSVTLSNTNATYCSVLVSAGTTLVIGGSVTLNVTGDVDIEGEVTGAGLGYGSTFAPSLGTGAGGDGAVTTYTGAISFSGSFYGGGGGGGYGGMGTAGGIVGSVFEMGGSAGATYGSATNPGDMGSQGGSGANFLGSGGDGGAGFILTASGNVTLNGTIDMSGREGARSPATIIWRWRRGRRWNHLRGCPRHLWGWNAFGPRRYGGRRCSGFDPAGWRGGWGTHKAVRF